MKNLFVVLSIFFAFNCFADLQISDSICSQTDCYTIISELGEGAFGKVYTVENSSGQHFALKVYKKKESSNELNDESDPSIPTFWNTLSDPEREYIIGQALNHPNIIKSIEFFRDSSDSEQQVSYLVLQLVEGEVLYKIPSKFIAGEDSRSNLGQLVNALDHALSLNFVHLDLHQGNVMLSNASDLSVIDLASFFSFDEIFSFIEHEIIQNKMTNPSAKEEKTDVHSYAAKAHFVHSMTAQAKNLPVANAKSREIKLRQFFAQHPEVFQKLCEYKRNSDPSFPQKKGVLPVNYQKSILNPILAHYFDNITEICLGILKKSTLDRAEKIEFQADIKKLSWNYAEDVEEGLNISIDDYFERLNNLIYAD